MTKQKKLRSVAHNIAHHAVSSLSCIHPHLRRACRLAGLNHAIVHLIAANPYPQDLAYIEPLFNAMNALKEKLAAILRSEGFSIEDLQAATLRFEFEPKFTDDYSSNCFAQLIAKNGKIYEHFVDCFGYKIRPKSNQTIN